jgi:hypothetical protein
MPRGPPCWSNSRIRLEDDAGSSARPMPPPDVRRSLLCMRRRRLTFLLLALLLLVLAIGGWAVEGARWALTGRRARMAAA